MGFESGVYEDGFGGGYETVYAVDKNGRKYDMPACITAQGNAMPCLLYTSVRPSMRKERSVPFSVVTRTFFAWSNTFKGESNP